MTVPNNEDVCLILGSLTIITLCYVAAQHSLLQLLRHPIMSSFHVLNYIIYYYIDEKNYNLYYFLYDFLIFKIFN